VRINAASVTQEKGSSLDDTTIQDAATKRLTADPNLASISVIVIDGRATLMGTVGSSELKAKAERVVKAVRGVKLVENKIEVSN
jgi:osmotically-inducible protein OsmY